MALRSAPLLALILLVFAQMAEPSFAAPNPSSISEQEARGAIETAEASSALAFLQVRMAEREGGNVTSLAMRFNEALEMLGMARAFAVDGIFNRAVTLADDARQLFDEISGDAKALQRQASEAESTKRFTMILFSPFIAVLVSLCIYLLIRAWQTRRLARAMRMKIEEA